MVYYIIITVRGLADGNQNESYQRSGVIITRGSRNVYNSYPGPNVYNNITGDERLTANTLYSVRAFVRCVRVCLRCSRV